MHREREKCPESLPGANFLSIPGRPINQASLILMPVFYREPVENLSDNLLRDFEDKWWKMCRDVSALSKFCWVDISCSNSPCMHLMHVS